MSKVNAQTDYMHVRRRGSMSSEALPTNEDGRLSVPTTRAYSSEDQAVLTAYFQLIEAAYNERSIKISRPESGLKVQFDLSEGSEMSKRAIARAGAI